MSFTAELVDDVPEGWSSSSPCYRILINPTEEAANEECKFFFVVFVKKSYSTRQIEKCAKEFRKLQELFDAAKRMAATCR